MDNFQNVEVYIDWVLRILQILSIFILIIKISFNKSNIVDNVNILQLHTHEQIEEIKLRYYETCKIGNLSGEKFLIIPRGVDLQKIEFYELSYNEKKNIFKKKRILKKENIQSGTGIILDTLVPCGIPNLRVRWQTSTGEIGEHTFHYNGFNGFQDMIEYKAKFSFWRKVMIFLGGD
ncbi:TPA: hypothetical protein U1B24_001039 [Streptococcus suis]|nr:hypothetical protein [Streptococcus suis]